MYKTTKTILFSLTGIFGLAVISEAAEYQGYTNFLSNTKNFTAPFDDVFLWENGTESEDVNGKILTLAALSLADLKQSSDFAFKQGNYYEINPVLGYDPSVAKMAAFGLAGIGTVYITEQLLKNHPTLRQILIDSVVSSEAFNVNENRRLAQVGARQMEAIPIIITVRW